ncbi:SDR family NAD(P)-dependent oxidoreductase [Sphingobium sp. 3R8]|uniref:SDR family NAD(P)-dependent oxidoreductase n=1 Tax=Sphingobium sp. 3R8 TaxID=2874921 RepID=UPI001CCC5FC5|nr:SDR family NAD(P)-dependent oxidoreductase [Sphingobium sp. 3R8]MBZ9646888.1 SDR family NAD(P)-dependent oxidoreductase [Sphingobium sp. 3R8]
MEDIRFDGQVAIVTGAGGGLGREYALGLAARGAKVVVNDLGGSVDGTGGSSIAAEAVVAEIRAAGGEAMVNGASVTDDAGVAGMVDQTMAAWGRIDVLIANAGILRDSSLTKMSIADFTSVLDVHLMGTVKPVKAVWDIMRAQNYGRIVFATSGSGLYGNFGQANYGAAKLAVIGLMNTLKIEGAKNDVRVNAIAPVAATRMTEGLATPEIMARIAPGFVTPGVLYLASRDAPTGSILSAGAGVMSLARIYETEGVYFGETPPSVEKVREQWDAISDGEGQQAYSNVDGQSGKFFRRAGILC